MHYLIYKTVNLINGKFYIGKHQTLDINDGYAGSGTLLKRAINKYGIENFSTSILECFDQEWKMNLAERILVVIDNEVSYNICSGGKGGFSYINKHQNSNVWKVQNSRKSKGPITEEGKLSRKLGAIVGGFKSMEMGKGVHSKHFINVGGGFRGKTHSIETIKKMSKAKRGRSTWNKGIPRSEDTKKKISESMKNILCRDKGIIWNV